MSTMGIFTSGYLSDDIVMPLMKIGPEYMQIVLKTEKAAEKLIWIGSVTLTEDEAKSYEASLLNEQELYLKAISEEMSKL